jgi:hypothetical protein
MSEKDFKQSLPNIKKIKFSDRLRKSRKNVCNLKMRRSFKKNKTSKGGNILSDRSRSWLSIKMSEI